jgi:hypothetical protein
VNRLKKFSPAEPLITGPPPSRCTRWQVLKQVPSPSQLYLPGLKIQDFSRFGAYNFLGHCPWRKKKIPYAQLRISTFPHCGRKITVGRGHRGADQRPDNYPKYTKMVIE